MRTNLRSLLTHAVALAIVVAPVVFNPSFAQTASSSPAIVTTPGSTMPAAGTKTHHKTHRTAYHHRVHHKPTGALPTPIKQ
jgi:hypothetical protein